ncbi:hypothetical protein ACVWZL_000743 [Bradyrhizobium sp. GM2.4]
MGALLPIEGGATERTGSAWRESDLHVRQMLAMAQHDLARSGEAEKALGVKL